MHDCHSSRTARLCGVIFTGLMLIGLLMPQAFASPGDDALEDRIEAREAGGQASVEGRTNDRLGDLSRRNARDRSSLRGGQEGDSLLDDPETARFFDKMPPEIAAEFGVPGVTAVGSESVESFNRPRPVPKYLFSEITGAELNGMPVVEFQITDEFGFGIEGFMQGENVDFSFTVNKLVPGSGGETNNWTTYVRADDEGVADIAAGTYADGTLEDLGGGNYSFTFNDPLEAISGIAFEPELTHRVGMEVRGAEIFGGSVPNSNTFDTAFDVLPSTGETEGIPSRAISAQENCTSCHGDEDFAFHGGARKSVEQCVSCHQPGAFDAGSGNTLDFRVMIHKIHSGVNLTETYEFCGFGCENFGAPPDNFNHVVYPQSRKNCVTCHEPENPATPQASNIDGKATAQVCASCHDNLAFDENGLTNANRNHIGLAQPNETCEACHSPNGLLQGNLAYHVIDSQEAAKRFSYNILDVTNAGEGQSPIVTFSITDPTNGDAPYDIASDPAFTGSGTRLALSFAWPNTDFTNVGNDAGTTITGRPAGQPISITLAGSGTLPSYITDNGDGTYTLDTMALSTPLVVPSTMPALGSGTVMIEGHPAADFDFDGDYSDSVPVTSATRAFAITDSSPQSRRAIVDVAKCQTCHNVNDGLALHGGNRSDNIEACASCHTPNATDLFRRPVDPDGVANSVNDATIDGAEDAPVDFKYMIHGIHGASVREEGYVAYGFGGTPHDYSDASYPRSPADCQACHDGDSYTIPIGGNVLATTVDSGATVTAGSRFGAQAYGPDDASAFDPTDDNNVSATTAVCLSCHNSDIAKDHMSVRSDSGIAFGNGWLMNPDPIGDPDTQAFIDTQPAENCSFCHSESGFVPVSEVHGIMN